LNHLAGDRTRLPMAASGHIMLILLFFVLGTSNTIVTKVIFTLQGQGLESGVKSFHKPAFGNWNMFFGMMLVLGAYKWSQRKGRGAMNEDFGGTTALMGERQEAADFKKQCLMVAMPALFDIFGTGLSLVGIILIPASVWQMLRGAEIIFAALLTVFVLKRPLFCFHWLGVCFALVGISCVSAATIFGSSAGAGGDQDGASADASQLVAVGVAVTLLSQVVQAAQIIAEERLLVDFDLDPLLVVSVEGVWGLLIMSFVICPVLYFAPGSDNGRAEDSFDTAAMISSSSAIQFFVVMDFLSCAVYNVLGQRITKEMSGMMRVMLEATRTMCVWIFNLVWHYAVDANSIFGEAWTKWSYFEAVGFLFLILGQMTYGEKIKWTCLGLRYPPAETQDMCSPQLRASPRAGIAAFMSPGAATVKPGS